MFDRRAAREEPQGKPRERDVGEKDGGEAKPESEAAPAVETGVDARAPIAEQFHDVADIPRRLAPDIFPQRRIGDAGRALEKRCREQGASPRRDVRLHLLGAHGQELGALYQLVGVAEALLLGGPLFGDGWIFGRRLVVGGRPQLIEPGLDFGEARRDAPGGFVDRISDGPDLLTRGDEIGVDQIVALERGLDVIEGRVRLVERLADACEVGRRRGRGRLRGRGGLGWRRSCRRRRCGFGGLWRGGGGRRRTGLARRAGGGRLGGRLRLRGWSLRRGRLRARGLQRDQRRQPEKKSAPSHQRCSLQ